MNTTLKEFIKSKLKNIMGIQISRVKKIPPKKEGPQVKMRSVHDPVYSYMINPVYRDMLIDELCQTADIFFAHNYFSVDSNFNLDKIIREFFVLYQGRGHTENTHGSGFHNAFWIYLLARALNPSLIVESGVWKGHTTWLLSNACPKADLFGFDIDLRNVEYSDLNAQLFEQDWKTYQFPEFNPENGLIFFDCHVNHAQRILEAKAKGFKHILFDDNPPVHKIFSHIPGIPTAAMLYSRQGLESSNISWMWNGKEISKTIDLDEANQAKELIKLHHTLPDVGGPTRYGGFAFLTYVQI